MKQDILFLLKQTFLQKRKFNISFWQACVKLSWITYPMCLWDNCCYTSKSSKLQDKLFDRGINRIEDSIDIVKLVKRANLVNNFIKFSLGK
jgi:hypothetical protein